MNPQQQQRRQTAKILGGVFLACMLASLAGRFWAEHRMIDSFGPSHIAASGAQVFVHANDTLFQLSGEGLLVGTHTALQTGLSGDLIDLRVLRDGRVLLAQQRPARLRACDTRDWTCEEIAAGGLGQIERQWKVLPVAAVQATGGNVSAGSLLVTDARGDDLWLLGGDGAEPRSLLPPGTLAGPNDLAFDAMGGLWIADTDHRRIAEWRLAPGGDLQPGRQHSTANALTNGRRYFPIMLAADSSGRWWVTQASESSSGKADVVIYDPDHGAISRVDLPGSTFPTDLALNGAHMLVSDLETFAVYAVDVGSLAVSQFGDDGFRGAMAGLERDHRRLALTSTLSLVGVVAFAALMIGAAVIATPGKQRFTPMPVAIDLASAPEHTPAGSGVHWLAVSPAQVRANRVLEVFTGVLPILGAALLLGGGLALYAWWPSSGTAASTPALALKAALIAPVVVLSILALVSLLYLLRTLRNMMQRRLGSDGKRLWMRLEDGRTLQILPQDLAYNGRVIFYRQYSIVLMSNKSQPLYQNGEVEQWIAPLLRRSVAYNAVQSLQHQWRHRDSQLMALVAFLAVLALCVVVLLVWQFLAQPPVE